MKNVGIRTVTTRSEALVAICRKCGKKVGGGFGDGGKASLTKALKKSLDLPKWKRSPIRIVETGCMKLCPKGAVAVTTSGDARLVYVVPAGTPVGEVAARLGLSATAAFGAPAAAAVPVDPVASGVDRIATP